MCTIKMKQATEPTNSHKWKQDTVQTFEFLISGEGTFIFWQYYITGYSNCDYIPETLSGTYYITALVINMTL